MVNGHSISTSDYNCELLIAGDLLAFEKVFRLCGAAVLQTETAKPSRNQIAQRLLHSNHVIESINTSTEENVDFGFSPVLPKTFMKGFPPFATRIFSPNDSVDVEICLSGSEIPCDPSLIRFTEMEHHDVFALDPARIRYRLCDVSDAESGCTQPSVIKGEWFNYIAGHFLDLEELPKKFDQISSPLGSDDFEELFNKAKVFRSERQH